MVVRWRVLHHVLVDHPHVRGEKQTEGEEYYRGDRENVAPLLRPGTTLSFLILGCVFLASAGILAALLRLGLHFVFSMRPFASGSFFISL